MPQLKVLDYSLQVHLGVLPEEHGITQEARISIDFNFVSAPEARKNDQIRDTLCYAEVCELIRAVATKKHFETIEHLNHTLGEAIVGFVRVPCRFQLKVHKVKPPVPGLLGGVIFEQGFETRG